MTVLRHPQSGDKVLWIRFWAFGDVIESAADAWNFKKRFPDVRLTFLSNPEYGELLRVQPYIDDVLVGRKKPFAEWLRTLRKIRDGHYKWLVSDHCGGRTSFLARFSGVPYLVGNAPFPFNRNYHITLNSWFQLLDLNVKDRSSPSIFAMPEDRDAGLARLKNLPERRLFVLIGAGNTDKMWKTECWIELLRALAGKGWGIVLNGHGPLEENIGRQIENSLASENVLNLVGALDFGKMASVACCCALALGNDTGPLHLAALSGVPTMGLFSRSTSRSMGLRMPWFREFCAENLVLEHINSIPLKALPAEPVMEAFESFAAEFLPMRRVR